MAVALILTLSYDERMPSEHQISALFRMRLEGYDGVARNCYAFFHHLVFSWNPCKILERECGPFMPFSTESLF